ncbi:DUF6531 domain-containing protein [Streptomyces sp. NPDC057494]|uniref:DUF6531 domain-containing protein n=1 Tax=Streptomyces sp. NPDC057494 TaxID=3346148 RepID=UPI0036D11C23
MAVTVPDWADTLLDLVGVNWPNVDEDAYRDMADALGEFADDLADDGQLANNHMERLLSSGHGEAIDALNEHWGKVKGKHLKDMVSAARTIAGALDMAAGAIEAMKWKAVAELGVLAGQTGLAMALIPVTGGLSALLGAGAIAFTKKQLLKLITGAMEEAVGHIVGVMTEPAVAALENMAADLVVQVSMDSLGVQNGVNLDQTKQAGKDGFDEGVQGAKEGLNLASAGGGGGGGRPGGKGFHIEHDEHDDASTKLNGVSVGIHGKTTGKLTKAKSAQGRNKGRNDIADALDPVIEKAMGALVKSAKTMGDHVGETLPKAVKRISTDHKNNDDAIRARLAKERKQDEDRGKDRKNTVNNGPNSKHSGSDRTRPEPLRGARDEPRRHAISLDKTVCENDPVDVVTGEMTLPQTDLSLPGVLPLVLRRTHLSEYRHGQWFGRSWASSLDERLELDPLGTGAVWAREDGSLLVYPELPRPGGEPVLPVEGDRLPLVHGGQHEDETMYTVSDPHSGLTRTFTGSPYRSSIGYWLAEIRDRNDNRVVFSRRPDGSPTAVTHTGGYTVQVSSEAQRVTGLALRGPDGPVTLLTYGYDGRGNLDAVTNSSGLALRFGYDEDDRITSWTDRNDSTFRYAYDDAGRVVRTIGPDGFLSSTFTYDPESRVTRYTDSTGATTVHHFNEHLQVVATTDPLGSTVHQSWDRHDNLLSRTDALGHTTRLDWDERGNLTAVRNPDGTALSCVYNDLDLPLTTVLPDGVELRQEYDTRGNRIRSTDEHGATTTFVYDGSGAPVAVTDTLGHTTTFDRDPHGLPLAFTDPLGAVTRYRRDAFGRTVAVEGPLGNTISFEWTTEGLLARRVEADGSEQSWTYDGEGNCLTHTDALGGVARFTYTHFDLMRSRTAPDGVRHEFVHDTERRLTQVVNPQGMTWNYSYDAAGRLAGETDFDGRSVGYTYDAVGRTTSRTNALGQQVRYEHDALGRILRKDADGQVTAFDYDLCGRLVAATAPGVTLSMTRDERGRPTAESVNGRTLTHAYDALGRRTGRTTPVGVTSQWAFDAAGNRTRLTTAGRTIDFGYDAAGRETTRDFGGAFTLAHAYDELGRLTTQSVRDAAGRSLHRRDYGYRADHTLTYTDDQHTGRRTFDLDAVGRVTAVHAEGWSERYAYDETGNQTEADWPRSHPGHEATGARSYTGTRVEHAGRVRYEHDGQGRVTLRRKAHLSGKVESWRYTWDAEDRLVGAVTPDGTRWRYLYDPFGRRVAKQRLDDAGEVVERTDFTWDGLLLCEQVTTSADLPRPVALTWDHQGTRPVAQTEHLAGQDEVDRRFFAIVTDLVGTPRELLDENGETAWRTRTTLWGTTTWAADSVAYTPLRFPGQYFDPETGLNYNHFRHYDPEVARYLTCDPLGLAPAANPFTYVHNPHTWTDHLGLAPECPTFPIYRTPKHKDKEYEKEHGPNPANHQPGVDMGGGYLTDGKIYFGERDVAAEYWSPNGGVNFANGMVRYDMHPDFLKEFTSSDYMKVYDTKGKDGAPRIEWTIPVDKLDRFNELVMKRTWIPYGEKG